MKIHPSILGATAAAFTIVGLVSTAEAMAGRFPTTLSQNSTGAPDSTFIGPPDDVSAGIGNNSVTYDFGTEPVVNLPGQDFNVYQRDVLPARFGIIEVEVSGDGGIFHDVSGSADFPFILFGAEQHGGLLDGLAASFNLPDGLPFARYVRIDGSAATLDAGDAGFDLDAIGVPIVPEPASLVLLGFGIAALGVKRLRRRR